MKRIYLLSLTALAVNAFAQAPKIGNSKFPQTHTIAGKPASKANDNAPPIPVRHNLELGKTSIGKNSIGVTYSDFQTNGSMYRHIVAYPNNKLSVTWTTAAASDGPSNGFNGRGSGYNTFDGTSWLDKNQASVRIEGNIRTGFPNIVYNSTSPDEEIIMSHIIYGTGGTQTAGNSGGLMFNTKPGIGSGAWTSTPVLTETDPLMPTPIWNRSIVSGDYLIVIANYTDSVGNQTHHKYLKGVKTPFVYSRYQFSTHTWLVQNQVLPGYDSTRYVQGSADEYSIDANGANVAILAGGVTNDMALWKSADNGATWTKTLVVPFPHPAYNPSVHPVFLDTTITNDATVNVLLDNSGKAHCFWGRMKVYDDGDSTNSTYYLSLGQNSIDYWYEGRPGSVTSVAGVLDLNGNGTLDVGTLDNTSRYGDAGLATMPQASIGDDGTLYLVYSGVTENDLDGNNHCYRDIMLVNSSDNGLTWSNPQNLTAWMGFNIEQMYGAVPRNSDNTNLHITYMSSNIVGRYDATNNPSKLGPFDINYIKVSVADIKSGKAGIKESEFRNEVFTVEQNYPNPFNSNTNIPVSFRHSTNAAVSISNLIGQMIYNNTFSHVPAGNSNLEINTPAMSPGVYFYTVEAEGLKVTKKMTVQ